MQKKFELFMVFCLLAASFLLARKYASLAAANQNIIVSDEQQMSIMSDESVHEHAFEEQRISDTETYDNITIVIDAGHGGNDPGKVGINGSLEKDINLSLALQLQKLLEKDSCNIIMTRTTDISLGDESSGSIKQSDLLHRVEIISEANADFVISIHQNSYSSESVSGPQVFYYTDSEIGKVLASCLQESLNNVLEPSSPRNIKSNSDYYLLKKSPAPTVIIECGFLSNPEEAELLTSSSYQEKVVDAIYSGIDYYINQYIKGK